MPNPITSACPVCGEVATRAPYDIGSGPELSCAACEWCWGAEGQMLKPVAIWGDYHTYSVSFGPELDEGPESA